MNFVIPRQYLMRLSAISFVKEIIEDALKIKIIKRDFRLQYSQVHLQVHLLIY